MSSADATILLLGATGQIGHALRRTLAPLGSLHAPGRDTADLAAPGTLRQAVREVRPDVVVNAAAQTDVDGAEEAPERARALNAVAPGVLAEAADEVGAWCVHYSTDYVFDGTKRTPYTEDDAPRPINVYGRTKLEGEEAVRAACERHLILRTSWVYSARRTNFLRTMLRLAEEKSRVAVVDDEIGTPTWAGWVAEATAEVLWRVRAAPDSRALAGTYHVAAAGQTSWYGFARAIFARFGREDVTVEPVSSDEHPTTAARPAYTALGTERLRRTFGLSVPSWSAQLRRFHEEEAERPVA